MSQEEELDRPQVNEEQSRQGCDAAEAADGVNETEADAPEAAEEDANE